MADAGRGKRLREVRPEDPLQDSVTWEDTGHEELPGGRGSRVTLKFSCGSPLQARADGRRGGQRGWLD